jgi:hypothetical protein
MGRGQGSGGQAPQDLQAVKNFDAVLGTKRGGKEQPAEPLMVASISPTDDQQIQYGERAKLAAQYLALVPLLPLPEPVPVWMSSALHEGFSNYKPGSLTGRLSREEGESETWLDSEAHITWEDCNPNKEDSASAILAIGTIIDVARWLLVYNDYLIDNEREFLKMCWRQLLPTVELPQ